MSLGGWITTLPRESVGRQPAVSDSEALGNPLHQAKEDAVRALRELMVMENIGHQ